MNDCKDINKQSESIENWHSNQSSTHWFTSTSDKVANDEEKNDTDNSTRNW